VLAPTLPHCKSDLAALLGLHHPNIHINVTDILRKSTPWASDFDNARLDFNGNTLGDLEFFSLEDVPHLSAKSATSFDIESSSMRVVNPSPSRGPILAKFLPET
jgi:hypothetical protein